MTDLDVGLMVGFALGVAWTVGIALWSEWDRARKERRA